MSWLTRHWEGRKWGRRRVSGILRHPRSFGCPEHLYTFAFWPAATLCGSAKPSQLLACSVGVELAGVLVVRLLL